MYVLYSAILQVVEGRSASAGELEMLRNNVVRVHHGLRGRLLDEHSELLLGMRD